MLKKLGLSAVSLLVALLAAELLLRLTGAAPEVGVIRKGRFQLARNPRIGYEPVPGLRYSGNELSFYDYQGAGNRLGYRDRDHAEARPAGVYRIVVLGDSIGAGLKIERHEDVFPRVLESLLRERGVDAEVLNFSVSGYNTRQEVETLRERGLRYRPDLVLLAYSLNDRERMDGNILKTLLDAERQQGSNAARAHPWLLQSALYRFLRYRVAPPRPPDDAELRRRYDLVSGDTVAESFGELARLSHEHRFEVLVAVFPRLVRKLWSYRFAGQHEFVRRLSEQNGFHHLDLLEGFRRCREVSDEPLGVDNLHPSVYGHRCAAEAMAQEILAQVRR